MQTTALLLTLAASCQALSRDELRRSRNCRAVSTEGSCQAYCASEHQAPEWAWQQRKDGTYDPRCVCTKHDGHKRACYPNRKNELGQLTEDTGVVLLALLAVWVSYRIMRKQQLEAEWQDQLVEMRYQEEQLRMRLGLCPSEYYGPCLVRHH